MPVVNIPDLGEVHFPDDLSMEEVARHSQDLYERQQKVIQVDVSEAEQLGPTGGASLPQTVTATNEAKPDEGRVEQMQSLGPAGPVGDIQLQKLDQDIPGFTQGVINSYKRGNLAAQRAIEAMQLKPGAVEPRMALAAKAKAFGQAMEDPAYMARLTETQAIEDPEVRAVAMAKVDELYGPGGRYQRGAVSPLREAQTATAGNIATISKEMQAIPQSAAMQEWDKADNTNWYKVLAAHPAEIIANVFAESLPQMAPSMAGVMAVGPVAGGAGSLGVEYANSLLDAAANQGIDLTKQEQVQAFFTDKNRVEAAKDYALKRGIPIALFDYATMKIAGKILGPVIGKGLTRTALATAGELGVQMAGGAGGEATAQLVTGQPFDIKAIASEAIAELASAPAEVLGNLKGELKIKSEQAAFEKAMNDEFDRVSTMAAKEAALEATLPPPNVLRGTIPPDAANAAVRGAPATATAVVESTAILAPAKGGEINGKENEPGLPSGQPQGQGTVQAQPEQGGGGQAPAGGGVLQAPPAPSGGAEVRDATGLTEAEKNAIQSELEGGEPSAVELQKQEKGQEGKDVLATPGLAASPAEPTFQSKLQSFAAATKAEASVFSGGRVGGYTGMAWELGSMAKTPEDVATLKTMAEDSAKQVKELMAKGDLEGAMAVAGKQPSEAYEFATGVKLDGTPKWTIFEKMVPGYVPSVPDQKYLDAHRTVEKTSEPSPTLEPVAEPVKKEKTEYQKFKSQYAADQWKKLMADPEFAGHVEVRRLGSAQERAKSVLGEKPAPKYSAELYQGRGASLEDIYGPEAVKAGRAVPILGKGQYFSSSAENAEIYGKVTKHKVELNNPIVIDSDNVWYQILQDSGATVLNSRGREWYQHPERIAPATEKVQKYLKSKGYDGAIIKVPMGDMNDRGESIKGLVDSFGHDQVVKFSEASRPSESRISSESKPGFDPFTADEGDLVDFLDEQFGDLAAGGTEGQAGRTGVYNFPDYESFRDWMDARYGELDLEGMKLAFAEAPTPSKVQYIKDNKSADAHKKGWVAHIATGAVLPTGPNPVARTTPRPGPPGTSPVPPPGSPPTTPPAPAAPRSPTGRPKFDTMALTQLLRQYGKFPTINQKLYRAYGRYMPGTGQTELMNRLFWDTQLAERVLAHEIGHFVDLFLTPQGRGLPFAERLSPLRNFKVYIAEKKAWRNEAKSLSRAWRGPFVNGDPYRDTAAELFADFMSAMLNEPQWVNQNFPVLHDAFSELLAGKPEFRLGYEEMVRWLQGDTMVSEFRNQQDEAVRKTDEALIKEKPKYSQSLLERLKGATVSTWSKAYAKEGRPVNIGSAMSDQLEYSNMWAAKENALFADDYQMSVVPNLDIVDKDIVKARSLLHQYSQAVRTIGERRAAGQWIEAHPAEARLMLETILNIDPTLRSNWLGKLQAATDPELYDLSAAIFREIHQRDRTGAFARKMAKAIDDLNLGVEGGNAMIAFNVRGKMLNPGGLTPENAQKLLDQLQAELTPEQWSALEAAASNLKTLLFDIQEKAYNEGLISKRTWDEIVEPNKDNYLPYAVLDYFEGKVGGGIKQQFGTAKDIVDVSVSTQLKVATLNAWRQSQRQVQLLRDVYQHGGTTIPLGEQVNPMDIDRIRKEHSEDDVSRAVLWQDGKAYLVEFLGDAGKSFEKAMNSRAFYSHMEWLTNLGRVTHGMMQLYTTLSLPFMIYRNPTRGVRTNMLRTGGWTVGKEAAKELYGIAQALASGIDPGSKGWDELGPAGQMAVNYARAAFGGTMSSEVRDLVDRQILMPPRLSAAMVRDSDNLLELIKNGGIMAYQIEKARTHGWPFWRKYFPTRQAIIAAEQVFTAYEAFEKIYTYNAALEKGLSEEKAGGIAIRAGIPKPGVGGHFSAMMEVFFPWFRVKMQGYRASLDTLRDPELRNGYLTRWAITEGAPRVAKAMVGAGIAAGLAGFFWAIRDDEDKDDPVMAEVMRRMSPYKMALDDVVPLMLYDPRTGKYHYFNEFKSGRSIPGHYEVVSFRIPSSEEGREFGPLLYNLMVSMPGIKDKMAKPGQDAISSTGEWVQNQVLPGVNPGITTIENLYQMILRGKNPDDPFRGQPSANKVLFDAGGSDRAQAIAGYAMNSLGWPGEVAAVMAMNFGVLDSRASSALKQRIASDKVPLPERIPLSKNMLAYDNYAQYREEGSARMAEEKLRAQTRLLMSPDVRQIYDYYWKNYERQDKLDIKGRQLFAIAEDFHRRWGRLKDPGSLYSKAASAVTKDSSKMAKETAKHDLDAASMPYVARWKFMSENE